MQLTESNEKGTMARDKVLEIILSEFPHLVNEIAELYQESINFLEICEDYVLCLNSIKNFESGNNRTREKELVELKLVLSDLKEEIFFMIKI